jgi:hypothetical protein
LKAVESLSIASDILYDNFLADQLVFYGGSCGFNTSISGLRITAQFFLRLAYLNMDVSALLGKSASPTTKRADKGKRKASELNGEDEHGPTQVLPHTTSAPKKMRVAEQSPRFSCMGKCHKCGQSFDMNSSAQACQFHPSKACKLCRLSCLADRINRRVNHRSRLRVGGFFRPVH